MLKMKESLAAGLRSNLLLFIMKVFETLHGGKKIQMNWHIRVLAFHLENCVTYPDPRLVITMPPRSLKSLCGSIALALWALGRDPSIKIICVSYSDDLARTFARQRMAIVESAWFRSLFPHLKFSKLTESEIVTTEGGGIYTTSIGGTLTGRGADMLIIDDPLKAGAAMSEAERRNVINWYKDTAYSRLNDKERGIVIIIAQRTHPEDLPGFVMATDPECTLLKIPAIAPEKQSYMIRPGEYYKRPAGQALHGERESAESLLRTKGIIGSYNFEAQYQQNPLPMDGNMVKREWFRTYKNKPVSEQIVQSWDTATETGDGKSWSVCVTAGIKENQCCLLDVRRARMDYPTLRQAVIAQAGRWNAHRILIEKAASGHALLQDLRRDTGLSLIPITPKHDKETRLAQVSAKIEAGQVYLPEEAPWLGEFMSELLAFPNGKHDDQVDALSQLLHWFAFGRPAETPLTVISNFGGGSVRDRYAERMGGSVFGNLF